MTCGQVGGCFQTRWTLVILMFLATLISYVLRTNISLTMVAMVNQTAIRDEITRGSGFNVTEGQCPVKDDAAGNRTESVDGPFVWNSITQGFLQGGFFYGYASTQIIGGRMSERFGPKYLIGCGTALSAILSFVSPLLANLGPYYLMTVRIISGMALGPLMPSVNRMFSVWIPSSERSRLYAIVNSGANAGILVSMPIIGWLCKHGFAGGWPSVFYLTGCLGLLWSLFWFTMAHDSPLQHPRISLEERQYILDSLPPVKAQMPVPWKSILTSVPVLVYIWTFSCTIWIFYTRVTELPTYLDSVLHIPILENGLLNSVVTLSAILFAVLNGILADYLINKKVFSRTTIRKIFEAIGQLGTALCLLGVTFSGCNGPLVLALLTLGAGLLSFYGAGSGVLAMEIAPSFSGTVFGLANTVSSITGFVTPLVTGLIVTGRDPFSEWHTVFYISVGVAVLGSLAFLTLGSAEPQPWNDPPEETDQDVIVKRTSSETSRESL